MKTTVRSAALIARALALGAPLQGCVLAAGTVAGAAGGYEDQKHGYEVQSPVTKDSARGYKGQAPVVKHPKKDDTPGWSSNGIAEPADDNGRDPGSNSGDNDSATGAD